MCSRSVRHTPKQRVGQGGDSVDGSGAAYDDTNVWLGRHDVTQPNTLR